MERIPSDPVEAIISAMSKPPRDPKTCAYRPCGFVDCCEFDAPCEHRKLARKAIDAALDAHVNDLVDQAREDRWDGDEDRAADDRCGGAW